MVQDSGDPERPRWHWLLIGAGFTVTLWLPLALLGIWLGGVLSSYVTGAGAWSARAAPLVLSFLLACFASSVLVGRFGSRAGRLEAMGANLLGSALIVSFAGTSNDLPLQVLLLSLMVLCCCALLSGWGGAVLGIKLRPKIR
jgi:hypothetical protein